ncbi:acyl-CoA dehydrogenase family protein [Aerococcaceae bacterium DSM 111021]|nr:acyl-CoA dehydrogenase family protein [Aerococcaceae bacterium DSM 111021]
MSEMTHNLLEKITHYTNKELAQVSKHYDATEEFPTEYVESFFKDDIFRLLLSEDSETKDFYTFLKIIQIVSKQFAALGSILLTQGAYGVWPLYRFGTLAQKEHYLEDMLTGKILVGYAYSELDGCGNPDLMMTEAIETENGWTINGTKANVSNASVASLLIVAAKAVKMSGEVCHGLFLVDINTPGVDVDKPMEKMGMKALPVSSVTLNDVHVAKDSVLGGILAGSEQNENLMNKMKLAVSAQALGIAQGSMEKGLVFTGFERQFGKRLIDLEMTQLRLAELETLIQATEAFIKQVVETASDNTRKVAMAKLMASNVAIETTDAVIQVTGGYGYMRNNDIERYVRDAKITAIYGGSSDSQKKIIAQPWLSK